MKVCYIISGVSRNCDFAQYLWTANGLRNSHNIETEFIFLGIAQPEISKKIKKQSFNTNFIFCRGKKDWIKALFILIKLLKRNKPEIIHCHLIDANVLGLFSGLICGIKSRVFTRQHGYEHHVRNRKSIIWDYIANILSTKIIATSKSTSYILNKLEKVKIKKICEIHNATDMSTLGCINLNKKNMMKKKYNIKTKDFVIGICSRFDFSKGYEYLIPGISKIFKNSENIKVLIFNAKGPEENKVIELVKKYLPYNSHTFIPFEKDMSTAYSIMDVFIHVPISLNVEGFGLVYIEAMGSKLPCIFTKSGIGDEILKNKSNSIIVKHKNQEDISNALKFLYLNKDKRIEIGIKARKDVEEHFDKKRMVDDLSKLYKNEFQRFHV